MMFCKFRKGIRTDFANIMHPGTGSRCSKSLVSTFTASAHQAAGCNHGFAGAGKAAETSNNIDVEGTEDTNFSCHNRLLRFKVTFCCETCALTTCITGL